MSGSDRRSCFCRRHMCPDQERLLSVQVDLQASSSCRSLTQQGLVMAGAIVKFEELPANARALLLAKLAVALRARNSASIHDLAERQLMDVTSLWRRICRKANQPICTIPSDAGDRIRGA